MKNRARIYIALAIAALLVCMLASASLADAGGFAGDSDWGGGSDWGGSDWGSSSDWGDSDWGSSSDWGDSDWSSGSDWGSSASSILWAGNAMSGCVGDDLLVLVVIAVVVIIVLRYMRQQKAASKRRQDAYYAAKVEPGLPLADLKAKDPNFNEQTFLERVGNHYIQMQDAWESKNWEPMRAIMTDALYHQMARQLQELIQAGRTNHVDRVAVLETRIVRYTVEGDNDVLVVRISSRICDYTTDDRTGNVVSGSQTRELFMVYDWKLIRNKDMLTLDQPTVSQVSCPNCGAPLDVNHTGKCPYCDTVVTLGEHDWALSTITGVSQRTAG